jgi:hypothetical protein
MLASDIPQVSLSEAAASEVAHVDLRSGRPAPRSPPCFRLPPMRSGRLAIQTSRRADLLFAADPASAG